MDVAPPTTPHLPFPFSLFCLARLTSAGRGTIRACPCDIKENDDDDDYGRRLSLWCTARLLPAAKTVLLVVTILETHTKVRSFGLDCCIFYKVHTYTRLHLRGLVAVTDLSAKRSRLSSKQGSLRASVVSS